MNILALQTGPLATNCYLVWGDEQQAIVFDPGDEAERIQRTLEQHRLDVAAYVCTHAHVDHIGALAALHRARPAPVAMHSADLVWAFKPDRRLMSIFPVPARPEVEDFHRLEQAPEWAFADLSFECMETPGHTPGSCCLFFRESGMLIAGKSFPVKHASIPDTVKRPPLRSNAPPTITCDSTRRGFF